VQLGLPEIPIGENGLAFAEGLSPLGLVRGAGPGQADATLAFTVASPLGFRGASLIAPANAAGEGEVTATESLSDGTVLSVALGNCPKGCFRVLASEAAFAPVRSLTVVDSMSLSGAKVGSDGGGISVENGFRTVPEPQSILLFGTGLLVVVAWFAYAR